MNRFESHRFLTTVSRPLLSVAFALVGHLAYTESVAAQDIPYEPPLVRAASAETFEPFDWQALRTRFTGEQFILPIQVNFLGEALNLTNGTTKEAESCAEALALPNTPEVRESRKVCTAVGLTAEVTLSPAEEFQKFQEAAQRQVDGINRAFIESGAPLRVRLSETVVGATARCANTQQLCLVVGDLLGSQDYPYYGYATTLVDAREPHTHVFDRPGQNAAHVDAYVLNGFAGCDQENTNELETVLCDKRYVQGNATVTHEVGHVLGLPHTFPDAPSCTSDSDEIPDTAPVRQAVWEWSCQPGEQTTVVDTCKDSGNVQYADDMRNVMSYAHECVDGSCSKDGQVFTQQQISRMLTTLENVYPSLFENSRVSGIHSVQYSTNSEGVITAVVMYTSATEHRLKLTHESLPDDPDFQVVQATLPSQGLAGSTPMGMKDTVTYTVPLEAGTSYIILQTKPFTTATGSTVFGDWKLWKLQAGDGHLGQTDMNSIEVSSNQPDFVMQGDAPLTKESSCLAVPFHYFYLPAVIR